MSKTIIVHIAVLLLIMHLPSGNAAGSSGPSALEGLIEEALAQNPELRAFEEKINAYEQRPFQARSLDDPMLRLSIANLPVDTFAFDQEAMTQKQITVQQKFPFPGKLDLKGDISERELDVVRQEYKEMKNSIVRQVKIGYNNYLYLNSALDISMENRNLLAELIRTAETKYAVGQGGQQEILKAQIEFSRIIKRIITLEQKKQSVAAGLNTLLNRPVQDELYVTGALEQTSLPHGYDELQKIAEETRPALLGLGKQVERARLAGKLAEREYYPDMDFGVSYGQREDGEMGERPDFFSASVTFNIPLWYRTRESRKVSEEKANERRAAEIYNAKRNNIYYRLKELSTEIEMYGKEIELYRTGLIPQSVMSFEAAMSGYKVNRVDFQTLISNQISLYNFKMEYYRAITDHENSLAELEETAGKRLY